jgi:hypothetical protein
VSLEVGLVVLVGLATGALGGGTLGGRTLAEWPVGLDLVLWAILVRHLLLLLGRALDARFLTY